MESILSIGRIIRALLLDDEGVSGITRRVFPVWTEKATLPYVVYYREKLECVPGAVEQYGVGVSARTSRTALVSVECLASGYDEAVSLAEAVTGVLDGAYAEDDGLRMRSCTLADSDEGWRDDAYVVRLVFAVKA